MDVKAVLEQVDILYGENRGEDAEALMQEAIVEAVKAQDDSGLLQLLNELLGYYRETSQVDASYVVASQAISVAENMGLIDSLPYATTLLNVANAYRAGGRLADSLDCYLKVRQLYEKLLTPDDMLVASLENNLSLLYQEMGEFCKAKECLLKALSIVEEKDAAFEVAVTCANLAGTCMQLKEPENAREYAQRAITGFKKLGVEDAHYGAALSALATYHYENGTYDTATSLFREAMEIMERNLGRNEYYERLKQNYETCLAAGGKLGGLALCREYYETWGRPMIAEKFGEYEGRIAVGLVGEGSDCFGYDDGISRDHDWGPGFCLWVTEETYSEIGQALQEAYEALPSEFKGCKRTVSRQGQGRRGVMTISRFYERLTGAKTYEEIDFTKVQDASLAAAVNGEVFRDEEGIFTAFREKLKQGYPEPVRYLKLAESAAAFSQCGQYNYKRMKKREDSLTASMMVSDCIKEAIKLKHYIAGQYPPHDKWLLRSLKDLENGPELLVLLRKLGKEMWSETVTGGDNGDDVEVLVERIGEFLAKELYEASLIGDTDPYLDSHTGELLQKSIFSRLNNDMLVDRITELEFEAFDKVKNEGGRASCQNDWNTFSIMRKSQYMTWNRTMLLQYLYDFSTAYRNGRNLITEKYGRMMESTAPEEYEKLKEHFPKIPADKKEIIEQIVSLQVSFMEDFAKEYPTLAGNARSIHSAEDQSYNTSYETYLRGEISTYSDKMLELYGRFLVSWAREGKNPVFATMENSVHLYGYESLDAAESFLKV